MRINLTREDISSKGLARRMVNQGFRLVHLSGYETVDGVRYAAVWAAGGPCDNRLHEAFRNQTSTQYQVKASAQLPVAATRIVADDSFVVESADLSGEFRIARLRLRHDQGVGGLATLNRILPGADVSFQHGDILVLQAEHGYRVTVNSHPNLLLMQHGIVLRLPVFGTLASQPFAMHDYQYRLVLQYNLILKAWLELERNELSPDYYWPTSIDEFSVGDERLYNSVWQAGPVERVWRVTGTPDGADPMADFDFAMQSFMQRRNIPGAGLAISRNGQLVLARGYTWEPEVVSPVAPDARFRMASVAKPLTAIGILRLVQPRADGSPGPLHLDMRIKDIPGFDAVLQSNAWIDDRIQQITIRQLLHHLGGWDRDDGVGDYMLQDFSVCKVQGTLPTTKQSILNYGRDKKLDWDPGERYVYSNFGYMLLGLIIETVSGQSYNNYMQSNVFGPAGASGFRVGDNFGTAEKEVRYYKPNNQNGYSVVNTEPNMPNSYDVCRWDHQYIFPTSYGSFNIPPMEAHGGWISSAVDLVKVMDRVDDLTLLDGPTRGVMWSRADGRSSRVAMVEAVGDGIFTEQTLPARQPDGVTFKAMPDSTHFLMVGRGLDKFQSVQFEFAAPGEGYELKIYLSGTFFKELSAEEHGFVDGTDNFSQDGSFTFTAPKEWKPIVIEAIDPQPRFYLVIGTSTVPTTVAEIDVAQPGGELNYALGWTSTETAHRIAFKNRIGSIGVGDIIVGEKSLAAAEVTAVPNPLLSSGQLSLLRLQGGPFRPNEKLLVGNLVVATAADREWATDAVVEHGGLLWGTRASIVRRTDGVKFAILLNQDNAYDPYWYLPDDMSIKNDIINLIRDFNDAGLWPAALDLYPEYP